MEEEKLTYTEAKLLHKVVSLEQKIAELKSQLGEETQEKLRVQKKHGELEVKGFQLGQELTEIIEQLTSVLLKEDEDGDVDGDGDKAVLRRNIQRILKSLKVKIQRLDYDKELVEYLKKMVNILISRKPSEQNAADQPEASDSIDVQSTTIVHTVNISDIKSELEVPQPSSSGNALLPLVDPSSPPEVLPLQLPMILPTQVGSDSDDDIVFLEEVERSPSPVPQAIQGQFYTHESESEESEDERDDAVPSTSQASHPNSRPRCVARKRTGGFVARIRPLEEQALVPLRKSARLSKPMSKAEKASQSKVKTMTAAESTRKDKHHLVATPKGSNGYHCACGLKYTLKNSLNAHVGSMTGNLKFKCRICKKSYFWYALLKRHMKEAHEAVLDPTNTLYGCSTCGDTFSSHKELCMHQSRAH